jgi:hypothetical protein
MSIEFRTRTKGNQPNPNDIGACCILTEDRTEFICNENTRYIECKRQLGLFRGKGSGCTGSNQCPAIENSGFNDGLTNFNSDQHGACKKCSGCTENIRETECINQENFDAEFYGGKTCLQIESSVNFSKLKHACCIDEGCFDTCNKSYCVSLGGIFHDGIGTDFAISCSSNPCGSNQLPSNQPTGACCKNEQCIGNYTMQDCENNLGTWYAEGSDCLTGGNFTCKTGKFVGDRIPPIQRPASSLEGNMIVCSSPTTNKYYLPNGRWDTTNGILPQYTEDEYPVIPPDGPGSDTILLRTKLKPRESVIVELWDTKENCENIAGGIVSATDGDLNKGIMWGGCQWYDGNPDNPRWRCEAKTFNQCNSLDGMWSGGIYCDDIRNWPVTGLILADTLPEGEGIKFLAGTCHIIDNIENANSIVLDSNQEPIGGYLDNILCIDMQTEFQCSAILERKRDTYEAQDISNDLLEKDYLLRMEWEAGKTCIDCNDNRLETDDQLGLCLVDTEYSGSFYRTDEGQQLINYTSRSGRQKACYYRYTRPDCNALFGEWVNTCKTCTEYDPTYPEPGSTGSCCTSPTECLDGKTYEECEGESGFFHGPGTVCTNTNGTTRDCGKVAYLTTNVPVEVNPAACICEESDNPDQSDSNIVKIFARQDQQNGNDIWAGSQCGDPTVGAIPLISSDRGYGWDKLGLYSTPDGINKFSDSNSLSKDKYNWYNLPFRDLIKTGLTGAVGSFVDSISIQKDMSLFFRIDKQEPIYIPKSLETLKYLRGSILQTNQPATSFYRLKLNDTRFGYIDAPVFSDRKITFVNLDGMTQLREFGVQGNNWITLKEDFESKTFPFLTILDLARSNLTGLNLSNCPAIESVNLFSNKIVGEYDLSNNQYITYIDLSYNNVSSIQLGDDDKIYLSTLVLDFNTNLNQVNGSFPQLAEFSAHSCSIPSIDLRNMPYLLVVELGNNPLTSFKISKTPIINYIGLDDSVTSITDLSNCILPTSINRNVDYNSLPDSIKGTGVGDGAIIPNLYFLSTFNFRNNTLPTDNYAEFCANLMETVAISFTSKFRLTTFSATAISGSRAIRSEIYTNEIDFSEVIESTSGDTSSVVELLKYLFVNAVPEDLVGIDINDGQKIRIILTGINTSVRWDINAQGSLLSKLKNSIPADVYSNLSFITDLPD